jgi:hypothetical protein
VTGVTGMISAPVVAVLGAKGAPGATSSVLALAWGWPRPVLVADADLAGGDIAAGWLGGRVGGDRGLLSFAAATRHAEVATPADLVPHVVRVPEAPGVLVLPGLAHAGQAGGLDGRLWNRLVTAAAAPGPTADRETDDGPALVQVDLLIDCGRISQATPWPLISAASVLLLATRPTLRGVHHARHALAAVQTAVPRTVSAGDRTGLLVCGPGPYSPQEVARAVGLPVRVVLPADPRAAEVLSDCAGGSYGGDTGWRWSRTLLARAARAAAEPLAGPAVGSASGSATAGQATAADAAGPPRLSRPSRPSGPRWFPRPTQQPWPGSSPPPAGRWMGVKDGRR